MVTVLGRDEFGAAAQGRMVNERHNRWSNQLYPARHRQRISRDMVKPSFSVSFPKWRVGSFRQQPHQQRAIRLGGEKEFSRRLP